MSEDPHRDEPVDAPEHAEELAHEELPHEGGRRRRRRSRVPGCLAVLVALAVVAGGLWWAGNAGMAFLRDLASDPDDYPGPGKGSVTIEVVSGDTSTVICRAMKEKDVVASVDACIAAANADPDAGGIQVGFYELQKQMAAADAIDVLVDPANIVKSSLTIPEGLRVVDISGELMGDLYRQGREIAFFLSADPDGHISNAPMVWGPQPHKGNIFFTDWNSGLWCVKLVPQRRRRR